MPTTAPYFPTLAAALEASNVYVANLPATAVGVQQHTPTSTSNANFQQRDAVVSMSQQYTNGHMICRKANLKELIPELPQPVRVFCKNKNDKSGNGWADATPYLTNNSHPANRETVFRPQQSSSPKSQKSTPIERATNRATAEIESQARACAREALNNRSSCRPDLPRIISSALGL